MVWCSSYIRLAPALGIFVLLLVSRRWPRLQIAKYFKVSPVLPALAAPPNSPSSFQNRRLRKMKPLRVSDGCPRPIQRVSAYSDLQSGVIFKNSRREAPPTRSLALASIHLQARDLPVGRAAGRPLPSVAGTLV